MDELDIVYQQRGFVIFHCLIYLMVYSRSVDMNKNKDIKNTVKEEIGGILIWKMKSTSRTFPAVVRVTPTS